MAERGEIVVFRKFSTAIDANIVKSKLDAYGIPCFLTEENMANLYPGASSLMNSNVRLHLFAQDIERAEQIMADDKMFLHDDSVTRCPVCMSQNIERDFPKDLSLTWASTLKVMFFGIFFPQKKVFHCLECDHEFT